MAKQIYRLLCALISNAMPLDLENTLQTRALTEIGLADRLLAYAAQALIRMPDAGVGGYNMRAERHYYGGRIWRISETISQ